MPIYVYLNGTRRGPFEEEQVRRMVSERVLQDSDLASNGDTDWKPIGAVLNPPASPAAEATEQAAPIAQPLPSREPIPAAPDAAREKLDWSNQSSSAQSRSYAHATLGHDESIFYKTSLHWIIFVRYAVLALLVFLFVVIPFAIGMQALLATQLGWFALPLPMLILIPPAVQFATSELVVTNRRVLIKTGAVNRQTLEMFISKVESVGVHQPFLGRLLDYGTVIIRGTGGSDEPFQLIAHPLRFRNAVQRMQSESGFAR